jgi:biopolymer transport protein ExbD
MKFPRNARIFRGQLDAAPFAIVFFLLVIFVMLGSLLYTPGVHLKLPVADNLPGLNSPSVAVAIDSSGRFFFENQLVEESELRTRLRNVVKTSREPLTLVVQADENVSYKMLMRLTLVARDAGINEGHLATLPRLLAAPATQ